MDSCRLDSLLSRAQRGDSAALEAIVAAYSPRVLGLLLRMVGCRATAEDLLQETFLRLMRSLERYEHDGRFEPFLFRIAANLARDQGRWRQRRGAMASYDAQDPPPEAASDASEAPDAGLLATERQQQLERALAELPEKDREILLLRHYGELSFKDIAEQLGVPLGTALARAHRALAKLRERLTDEAVD